MSPGNLDPFKIETHIHMSHRGVHMAGDAVQCESPRFRTVGSIPGQYYKINENETCGGRLWKLFWETRTKPQVTVMEHETKS